MIKTTTGSRRRDEEQSDDGKCRARKEWRRWWRGGGLVVARNEHSSLNVPSFSAETVPRVAPPSGITSGIYEPFILKMVAERRDPKQVATKNFEYGIQPPSSYI